MKAPTKNTTGVHPMPGYMLVEVVRDEDSKPLIILPRTAQAAADEKPFEGTEHVFILEHKPLDPTHTKLLCGTRVLVEPEEQVRITEFDPRIVCIIAEKYVKGWVESTE